jgi:hypothetical protein
MSATAIVIKLLGVLVGGTMFAFGVADGNPALFFFGTLLLVLSLLLGPRSRDTADHA